MHLLSVFLLLKSLFWVLATSVILGLLLAWLTTV